MSGAERQDEPEPVDAGRALRSQSDGAVPHPQRRGLGARREAEGHGRQERHLLLVSLKEPPLINT